ncbi:MAG TPA: Crp/Fnr family transcriptional regulator [Chitinophagaceae bacterium]|nr:Crp/Fnr family transcriptional regulator [Chitinophagaceae bacterium]
MTNELHEFLSFYLPNSDLMPFVDSFVFKTVKKTKFYITPGRYSDTIAFIQKGSFRVYFIDAKGRENTTWFSFQGMVITDMLAFYTGERASFYAQALEDSELHEISKQQLENLYKAYPEYREFGRKFAEEALTMLMQRTLSLQIDSAEKRYRQLLQQPEFMQKIPLKYLASYLGITDTSLSRLRRKIR